MISTSNNRLKYYNYELRERIQMNILQLEYVIALAKHKNFSNAADSVFVSQSSFSQQIIKLEKEIGIKLFRRTTRDVNLTEVGKEFVKHAYEILARMESLKQSMSAYSGMLKGTLNIGTINVIKNIDFNTMITTYYNLHPDIRINIIQAGTYNLLQMLQNCAIDIAFITKPIQSNWPDISITPLGSDTYALVVPSTHPLAHKREIRLSEFINERFISPQEDEGMYSICQNACMEARFKPNIICTVNNSSIRLKMIEAGLGVGFFPQEDKMEYLNEKVIWLNPNPCE